MSAVSYIESPWSERRGAHFTVVVPVLKYGPSVTMFNTSRLVIPTHLPLKIHDTQFLRSEGAWQAYKPSKNNKNKWTTFYNINSNNISYIINIPLQSFFKVVRGPLAIWGGPYDHAFFSVTRFAASQNYSHWLGLAYSRCRNIAPPWRGGGSPPP